MIIFGIMFKYTSIDKSSIEPRWSNTNHGNRHQRIFAFEKIISYDNLVAYGLFVGRHQIQLMRMKQKQHISA
jgi:hypothetical protein